MKLCLANVGSVSLWAEITKGPNKGIALTMESTLAGQPRSIGMLLLFDDLAVFRTKVQILLKESK